MALSSAAQLPRLDDLSRRRTDGGMPRGETTVTSLYVDADGRGHRRKTDRQRCFGRLARQARERAEELGPATTHSVLSELDRIAVWLDTHRDDTIARGLAFFASSTEDPVHVFVLPRVVRDQVTVGRTADVRQLQAIIAGAVTDTALLVGPERSRIFGCRLGEVTEVADICGGSHLARAVDLVAERMDRNPDGRLLAGGPALELDAVVRQLPAAMRPPRPARLPVTVDAPASEVERAVLEAVTDLERAQEATTAAAVLGSVRTGGAVPGLEWTLAALSTGGARLLLVAAAYEAAGARCAHCGMLTPPRRSCPRCGRSMSLLEDVIIEAIGEAPARDCAVRIVADDESTDALGGVAAVLHD